MQITILGTASMVPSKDRAHAMFFISYKSDGVLFDAGENVQRQLKIAGIPITKVTKIFISHLHGDHVFGLPALLASINKSVDFEKTIKIFGPRGIKGAIKYMFKAFIFDKNLLDLEIKEIKKGKVFENRDYKVEALPLEHGTPCFGYSLTEKDKRKINMGYIKRLGIPQGPLLGELQQGRSITFKEKKVLPSKATTTIKGKKIAYIADTLPCANTIRLAKDADIVICEATFASDLEKKAEKYKHLTAKQAAIIAAQADAKKLVLTHFSNRYKTTNTLEEDAKTQFKEVIAAKDFMRIKL